MPINEQMNKKTYHMYALWNSIDLDEEKSPVTYNIDELWSVWELCFMK